MTITPFEDRLLAELRHVVATRVASEAIRGPRRRRAPRVLLGSAASAAVAGAALLVAVGGGGVAPAFAVDRQPDGSVTVTINRLSDSAGLQSQLRAAGIAAVVDYTPLGKTCREPRGSHPASVQGRAHGSVLRSTATGGAASFTISRSMVAPGQTLVIMTSGGAGLSSVGMEVAQGPVSPCQLVDAPPPPAVGGGSLSTQGASQGNGTGTESRSIRSTP
jgi:hypothetical protein